MTQVIGIGNAMVDVISSAEDTFLDHMGIEKGIMQLVDRERAEILYAAMSDRVEAPGGSVANTIAGIGALGMKTAFIGKVKNDALGRFYAQSLADAGTEFPNPPVDQVDAPTSRSMIFVSPDGERSMNTYLGAGADLDSDDVSADVFEDGGLLFLEGYLFDKDAGKSAFQQASALMHKAGGITGITLSDPFCCDRHRVDFLKLIRDDMDITIGNRDEWLTLYETENLEEALSQAAEVCQTIVCTRSGDPVIIIRGQERHEIPVNKVTPVDATGAGDQFAAGFLFGLASGKSLNIAGRMGVIAGAEVVSHIGPRPQVELRKQFEAEGLI